MSPICTGGGIAKPLANKWQKEKYNLYQLTRTKTDLHGFRAGKTKQQKRGRICSFVAHGNNTKRKHPLTLGHKTHNLTPPHTQGRMRQVV